MCKLASHRFALLRTALCSHGKRTRGRGKEKWKLLETRFLDYMSFKLLKTEMSALYDKKKTFLPHFQIWRYIEKKTRYRE